MAIGQGPGTFKKNRKAGHRPDNNRPIDLYAPLKLLHA